ncbi:MAG: hypothetical protein M1817_006879 [Caeruleum heppii]|nr:MAG: hypothetical protein M1817_006879 [Caeruleum heppii]
MADRFALETPILRVSRPVSACSRCQAAKIKCDGRLPACGACEKSGRGEKCASVNDQFAKGKERSYVAHLESRVEKLQRRLDEANAARTSAALSRSPSAPVPTPSQKQHQPQTASSKARLAKSKEASDMDALVSEFGFLIVNATSRDFFGFTSDMSFGRFVLSASTRTDIPWSSAKPLPPKSEAIGLVRHYLQEIFVFLPFFSETALFASIQALYHAQNQPASDWDHWMVFMVLAVAAASRSSHKADVYYHQALGYTASALKKADSVLHPGSVFGVQAILFLVQLSLLQPKFFESWYLMGLASRAMVDLGLHQDQRNHGRGFNKETKELRRRVFHCVYVLDRSISMSYGRAFSFSDDSIDVPLPATRPASTAEALSRFSQMQPLEPFVHLIRVRRLQSGWYQELFRSDRTPFSDPFTETSRICQKMHAWFDETPPSVSPQIRRRFQLELLYSYVLILSPSRKVPTVDDVQLARSQDYCVSFVDNMRASLAHSDQATLFTYHDALRVYFVGLQLLDALGRKQQQSERDMRAVECISEINDILQLFGRRWEDIMILRENFRTESDTMLRALPEPSPLSSGTYVNTPPDLIPTMQDLTSHNTLGASWTNNVNPTGGENVTSWAYVPASAETSPDTSRGLF